MVSIAKSMVNKTLKVVISGWTPPTIKDDDSYESLKLEKNWDTTKDEVALRNSHALMAIYNRVNKNIFRIIRICISDYDIWEILKSES